MRIFVSYTIKDAIITTDLLRQEKQMLERQGMVFVDALDNDSIDKQKRVMEELTKCDKLVLLETPSVYDSKWVQIELSVAKSLGKPIEIKQQL